MSTAAAPEALRDIDVLILAGGLGTRLRPAIGQHPKLLAPIDGRPFLALLLAWLRRLGVGRVVLSLGWRAEEVLDYLATARIPGMDIVSVVEPEPLGTAGALRFARSKLASDPVLVMNGDSYVGADLSGLVARYCPSGALGTILCAEVEDAGRFGRVAIDSAGRVTGFAEKDPNFHGRATINAGVYLLSARLLDEIAAGDARSLERDVFERLPAGSLTAMSGRFPFIDIGTPESLAAAAGFFATFMGDVVGGTS